MKTETTSTDTIEQPLEKPLEKPSRSMCATSADLFVECLVNEGVHVIYGIPGEENIPLMEALERDGRIRFVADPP